MRKLHDAKIQDKYSYYKNFTYKKYSNLCNGSDFLENGAFVAFYYNY